MEAGLKASRASDEHMCGTKGLQVFLESAGSFFWVDCWSKIVRGLVCRASAGLLSEMSRGYKDDIGGEHLGMVRIHEGLRS